MSSRLKCLSLVLAALIAIPVSAAEIRGRVVGVHDGDTLTVLTAEKQRVKVRLAEIDAPECGQPFARNSKAALSALAFNKVVTVEPSGKSYDRVVGMVTVDGAETDVAVSLVSSGAAWVYPQYQKRGELSDYQDAAIDSGAGIWGLQADQREEPWNWRRAHRTPIDCDQRS